MLAMQSRRVGNITVVKCSGPIVDGPEATGLRQYLDDLLHTDRYIILDLGEVHFIDSSGLGLLVRLLTRIRAAGGNLKLCAISPKIEEVLAVTRLSPVFESHQSEDEAIADFYRRGRSAAAVARFDSDILCVEKSADLLAYLRELLGQAGYGVTIVDNLPDALILLRAGRPKVLVLGDDIRSATGTRTAEQFRALAGTLPVVELPADFSRHEAGDAGRQLLDRVRTAIGDPGPSVSL